MQTRDDGEILVTGATGFVGRALVAALVADGRRVVAASRRPPTGESGEPGGPVSWRECDLLEPETIGPALQGVRAAYYLVHSMGGGRADFRELERHAAEAFVDAAARSDLQRIVYLGGPSPEGEASEHLRSRLAVGEILRAGAVPTIELRASMVIGAGGASWQIVRDLALRLPFMVLPKWLHSRTRPVALADVIAALVGALDVPITESAWFDLPGPETLSGREILERIAALRGRKVPMLEVPLLTPRLSALWLKLVTRADFSIARELVVGLQQDLLSNDERYWQLIDHTVLLSFDDAARRALAAERPRGGLRQGLGRIEERLVDLAGGR
jgi:uncharacterized protein YbjT (DUF2867 family)